MADLEKQLGAVREEYRDLMEKQLPAFNRDLFDKGITPLATGGVGRP